MSNLVLSLDHPAVISSLLQPSGALGLQPGLDPAVPSPRPPAPSEISSLDRSASEHSAETHSARCTVKGCVFPIAAGEQAECRYHLLVRAEAELFQSHQPSHLLTLQPPMEIPQDEGDYSRQQDRRRQAAEREAFILDATV